jgi:type II secretory pathway component GspD/PulD (secretin)
VSTLISTSLQVLSNVRQLTPFQEFQRDVIIVAEPVTNQLLISATPSYFTEVMRLIQEIDTQPPQVVIQVLVAEVDLTNEEEFGVEIGLQNPVLFRRSVGATTINTSIVPPAAGFNFNNPALPLPNSFAADPGIVGFQSLGNFGAGRVSTANGLGGFVFSAANDTFNLLVRALRVQGRIDVLSRPQIQVMDNQQGQINIGQLFPLAGPTTLTAQGFAQTQPNYVPVGVNLTVVPRINPDGTIIMRLVPDVSSVGVTVPLSSTQNATAINQQHMETTVLAADGETVAIGGMIQKRDEKHENKIPWVGDLPYVGALFRYRTQSKTKTELLIIMTPHIVRSQLEADRMLAEEARRMDWVAGDVVKLHGTSGMAPILSSPGGPSAGLPGVPPNASLCPSNVNGPPLPGQPLTAPLSQETMPIPRTTPGPQGKANPGTTTPTSWNSQQAAILQAGNLPMLQPQSLAAAGGQDPGNSALPADTPKEKRGWNLSSGQK